MSCSQHGLLEIESHNIIHCSSVSVWGTASPSLCAPEHVTPPDLSPLARLGHREINVLGPSAVELLLECPDVLWSFYRRGNGPGSHPPCQDSRRSRRRELCRQYSGTGPFCRDGGRQTSPCDLETSDILSEGRRISCHSSAAWPAWWWRPPPPRPPGCGTTCPAVASPAVCNMMIVPQLSLCISCPASRLEVEGTRAGSSETEITWLEAEADAARSPAKCLCLMEPGSHCICHSRSPQTLLARSL